ncbi:MAG: lysozyme inhibitor LprI family protein [Pseudomonadota bacterium]
MKNSMRIILFLLMAFLAHTSRADAPIKCSAKGNQLELNACASDDFARTDTELNRTYQLLLKEMADEPLFIKKLRVAQNAWLVFRDADLDARFSCPEDDVSRCWGSMYPMSFLARKTALTKERIRQLQQILKDGIGQ